MHHSVINLLSSNSHLLLFCTLINMVWKFFTPPNCCWGQGDLTPFRNIHGKNCLTILQSNLSIINILQSKSEYLHEWNYQCKNLLCNFQVAPVLSPSLGSKLTGHVARLLTDEPERAHRYDVQTDMYSPAHGPHISMTISGWSKLVQRMPWLHLVLSLPTTSNDPMPLALVV